eukprot:8883582-Alexandrium_andersonii.AAC.1
MCANGVRRVRVHGVCHQITRAACDLLGLPARVRHALAQVGCVDGEDARVAEQDAHDDTADGVD